MERANEKSLLTHQNLRSSNQNNSASASDVAAVDPEVSLNRDRELCEQMTILLSKRRINLTEIKHLIGRCSDVNHAAESGKTPLHAASREGHIEAVIELVNAGAYLDQLDKENGDQTALHYAARSDRIEVMGTLLNLGACFNRVDEDGQSPLYAAARAGFIESLEVLLPAGADFNKPDNNGMTPLFAAVKFCHNRSLACVQYLVEDAHVNLDKATHEQRTPLHAAACSRLAGRTEMINYLVNTGASLNQVDADGQTALHVAIKEGLGIHGEHGIKAARALILLGADLYKEDAKHQTPLMMLKQGKPDKVEELLMLVPEHPVKKDCPPFRRCKNLCREVVRQEIHKISDIDNLPLPSAIKGYLRFQ